MTLQYHELYTFHNELIVNYVCLRMLYPMSMMFISIYETYIVMKTIMNLFKMYTQCILSHNLW